MLQYGALKHDLRPQQQQAIPITFEFYLHETEMARPSAKEIGLFVHLC